MKTRRLVIPGGRRATLAGVGVATSVMLLTLMTVVPASAEHAPQELDVATAAHPDNSHPIGAAFAHKSAWEAAGIDSSSAVFPVEAARAIGVGVSEAQNGELIREDAGRDWYSFEAVAGQSYIIELKSRMSFEEPDENDDGEHVQFVVGHLADPSILEVVDASGAQVLSEHDGGGIIANFARAFFTPDQDGTYRIAVGAGLQDREGLGWYTISVRADDHADDYRTDPAIVIRPEQSAVGRIDSDVDPDDPRLNSWDWIGSAAERLTPHPGIESMDDRDVFRMEITETGWYNLSVTGGPPGVGIWRIFDEQGDVWMGVWVPITIMEDHIFSGTYFVVIGTPHESSGNTGAYTVTLGERLIFQE